jgi:hypothetical protein
MRGLVGFLWGPRRRKGKVGDPALRRSGFILPEANETEVARAAASRVAARRIPLWFGSIEVAWNADRTSGTGFVWLITIDARWQVHAGIGLTSLRSVRTCPIRVVYWSAPCSVSCVLRDSLAHSRHHKALPRVFNKDRLAIRTRGV